MNAVLHKPKHLPAVMVAAVWAAWGSDVCAESASPAAKGAPSSYIDLISNQSQDLFEVPPGASLLTREELRRRLLDQGYAVKIASKAFDSAKQQYRLSRRQLLPVPTVTADVGRVTTGKDEAQDVTNTTSSGLSVAGALPYGFDYVFDLPKATRTYDDRVDSSSSATQVTAGGAVGVNLLKGAAYFEGGIPLDLSEIDRKLADLSYRAARITALREGEAAYFDIVERQFSFIAQKNALKASKTLLDEVREMIRLGVKERYATLKIELQIAQLENELVTSEASVDEAFQRLRDLLSIKDEAIVLFPDPAEFAVLPEIKPPTLTVALATAQKNRADFLSAKLAVRRAALGIKTAFSAKLPALKLRGSAVYGGQNLEPGEAVQQVREARNPTISYGLNFNYVLGDSQAETNYRNSVIDSAKVADDLSRVESLVRREVTTALRNLVLGVKGAVLARRARELADLKVQQEYEKFKLGEGKIRDVTDAQKERDDGRAGEIRARINVFKQISNLRAVQGLEG